MDYLVFVGDGMVRTIAVDHPYVVVKQYDGTCSKNAEWAYRIRGGGVRLYFTKYYVVAKVDNYGLVEPFSEMYVGCYKNVFYITRFDVKKEKFVILYKNYLEKLPNETKLTSLLGAV